MITPNEEYNIKCKLAYFVWEMYSTNNVYTWDENNWVRAVEIYNLEYSINGEKWLRKLINESSNS